MRLSERIVLACYETRGLTAEAAWQFACAHGWKNARGAGGGGGWLPWCAVAASMRVYRASSGAVTLAFGQPQKLALSRFAAGNASVPRISDDARRLGIVSDSPKPGMLGIIEVRKKGAEWIGKRSHIGIVTDVVGDRAIMHEGNLGGRDVHGFRRRLTPRESDRERLLEFVDLDAYARMTSGAAADDTATDDSCEPQSDDLTWAEWEFGNDFLALVPGDEAPRRCRVVGMTTDGLPLLQPVGYGGEVSLDAPIVEPENYTIIGSADDDA